MALQLVHCKASSKKDPGSRVEDLYEVCGQAMKCVHRRRNVMATLGHLRRRAQNRLKDGRHDGVRSGLLADLDRVVDEAALLRPEFEVVIVQPGLSRAKASRPLLELLGATETYFKDAGGSRLGSMEASEPAVPNSLALTSGHGHEELRVRIEPVSG